MQNRMLYGVHGLAITVYMYESGLTVRTRAVPPPLIQDTLRTDVLSELLKLQKFGHLFIGILYVFLHHFVQFL